MKAKSLAFMAKCLASEAKSLLTYLNYWHCYCYIKPYRRPCWYMWQYGMTSQSKSSTVIWVGDADSRVTWLYSTSSIGSSDCQIQYLLACVWPWPQAVSCHGSPDQQYTQEAKQQTLAGGQCKWTVLLWSCWLSVRKYRMPNVVGCIDETHVPVEAPANDGWAWITKAMVRINKCTSSL